MEVEVAEKELKAAGAELFADGGRRGLRIHGWEIESRKGSILNSSTLQQKPCQRLTCLQRHNGSLEGISGETSNIHWEDCKEQIDVVALMSKEPILLYDEVILYEDELADNGVSLLTVKMLRVDGVLVRLRDTRMHCLFGDNTNPIILKESWREFIFQALAEKGHPLDSAAYNDPRIISQRLHIVKHRTEKLIISS